MKARRAAVATMVSAALATAIGAGGPAGAQPVPEPHPEPLNISPDHLVFGEPYSVSGDNCLTEDGPGTVTVWKWPPRADGVQSFPGITVDPTGHWSVFFTTEAEDIGMVEFGAQCFAEPDDETSLFDYNFNFVPADWPDLSDEGDEGDDDEYPAPAPDPDPAAPSAPAAPAQPAAPTATPATPVVAQPRFNG